MTMLPRDRPRRVLFLCNDAAYFRAHWGFRAATVAQAGFDVRVAVPNPPADGNRDAWLWHLLPIDRRGLNPASNLTGLRSVRRVLREADPDLVVPITIKPNLFAALAIATGRPRHPLVMNFTGLGFLFTNDRPRVRIARMLTTALLRWSARRTHPWAVFENQDDRDLFVSHRVVSAARACLLGGAGIDVRAFTPVPEPLTTAPIVLLPSRMLWDKGVQYFVDAARQLAAEGVTARFVLAGETDPGNPSAIPLEVLRGWAAEGVVEWLGHCDDMPALMQQASVVCLPTHYREGIPRVLMEAAASSRPIVTTDNVGCRDFVRHERNGLLVPVHDATALAAALRRLLQHPELRERLGRQGRALVEEYYTQELVAGRTVALYESALAAGQTA